MHAWAPALLTTLAVLLGGCVAGAPDAVEPSPTAPQGRDVSGDLDRDAPDANATARHNLGAPPAWRLGEWWDFVVHDTFSGAEHRGRIVVGGTEGASYLVGMPRDAFNIPTMVIHIPGFGQVSRADLSFEVHDEVYAPLRFPLVDGDSYPTLWEGRPVNATVKLESDRVATIRVLGGPDDFTITYDADLGFMSRITSPNYPGYEITDHGYGYEGLITVPHMHDVIFMHGRFAGVAWVPGINPQTSVTDEVRVDTTYDQVAYVLITGPGILGNVPVDPGVIGYYHEKATAPDGAVVEATHLPTDGAGFTIVYGHHDAPGGTWKFEHTAAGVGVAMAEGIAYHVYDIELPSGRILPSTGEHMHGDHGH